MTSTHTLLEERDRFYSDLRFNKNRFIDFLGAMAKHYRHPIHTQIGLFFHGSAAGVAYDCGKAVSLYEHRAHQTYMACRR